MAATSNMFLYSLTIQPPTAIAQAIVGLFSGTKEQQILTASGSRLALLRQDVNLGKLSPIITQDLFGIIRPIAAFRLAGSSKGKQMPLCHDCFTNANANHQTISLWPPIRVASLCSSIFQLKIAFLAFI